MLNLAKIPHFLALSCLFFLTAATPEVEVRNLDTKFSDYLTAIYAREAGDVDRAVENYLRVLKKDPANLKVKEEAYTYFVYIGEFELALEVAGDLQELEEDHASSAMLLALENFKKGREKNIEKFLPLAKGLGFDVLAAPLMRAWIKAEDGDLDQALLELDSLRTTRGFEDFYNEHRAMILDFLGEEEEAEVAYLALLNASEVTSLQPLFAYAALLQEQERDAEAVELLEKFRPTVPDNKQLEHVLSLLRNGREIASIADNPSEALAMALLRAGVQLSQEQAFFPSIIYARFATFLRPRFDEAYLFLGNLLSSEPYPELSLEAFGNVDEDGVFGETAQLRRALVLNIHDRREEGIELIEGYIESHGPSFEALVSLGDFYRFGEEYAKALPYYEQAVEMKDELKKEDWFLLFTRGICYERLDRWPEAEADFLKTLELKPEDPDVLNYLGYSWIDRGMNLEKGRAMIEKAVEQRPNNGPIVDSLGWAQYLMGEYEEAVVNLEKAVTLEPGDPTINDHLGDAYWKVGRHREARFQWDHALKLESDQEKLEKLHEKIASGLPENGGKEDSL